jgi:hypothetical protein
MSFSVEPFGLKRMAGLAVLTAAVAAAVAYLQVTVPLAGPSLARAAASEYWQVAVIAGLVVVIAGASLAWLALGASKRTK